MSKYVRTKNEIIYVGDLIKDEYGNYCKPETIETDMEVPNKYIIKESDNLKELCDSFYWDWEDGFDIHNFMNYSIAKDTWNEYVNDCLEDNEKPDKNMYGCIKTSKGVIYATKMDMEGELELL